MPRFLPTLSFVCTLLAAAAASRPAHAQSAAKPILTVEISPGEPELDPSSLRAAIGAEIGDEAVAPEDPRAASAVGTVSVSVDRAGHALVVAYRGEGEPLTRRVDLPPDPRAIGRAAVLLAGNLARDEGDELARSLRKAKPESARTPSAEATEAQRALDRLGEILAANAARNQTKAAVSSMLLVTGGVATAVGSVVASVGAQQHNDALLQVAGESAFVAGGTLMAVAVEIRPGDFSELVDRYDSWRQYIKPAEARADLEQMWRAAALTEHHRRYAGGLILVITGGVALGLGGAGAVWSAASPSQAGSAALPDAIGLAALGAELVGFGAHIMTSKGNLESAFVDYERSIDANPAPKTPRLALRPILAPIAGGGFAGFAGEF